MARKTIRSQADIDEPLEAQKRWREANRADQLVSQKRWRDTNREKQLASQKRWRDANREKVRDGQRRWREAQRELRDLGRAQQEEKNRLLRIEAGKKWNEENKLLMQKKAPPPLDKTPPVCFTSPMSHPVSVAPVRDLRGLSVLQDPDGLTGLGVNGKLVRPMMDPVEVADLFGPDHTFPTDAHFTPYVVSRGGISSTPRLRKEALPQLLAAGWEVNCYVVPVDLDLTLVPGLAKGASWENLTPEELDRVQASLDAGLEALRSTWLGYPAYIYTTKHGLRTIHLPTAPVPAMLFESLVGRVHAAYLDVGLPVDLACKDWTRLFRCPQVTREDGCRTWEAPWYSYTVADNTFEVPDNLVEGNTPARVNLSLDLGDRPDDDEATALVWTMDGGKRKLTPGATAVEFAMRNTAHYAHVFRAVPIPQGERHTRLTQIIGNMVRIASRSKAGSPELVYGLALEMTRLMDGEEDWASKAWEMTRSFWARDAASPPTPEVSGPEPEADPLLDPLPEEFACNEKGVVFATLPNVRLALHRMGVKVSRDEFAGRMTISGFPGFGPTLDDDAIRRLWFKTTEELGMRATKNWFFDAILDLARARSRHPVREYLDSLQWDGRPRADGWLTYYLGVEDDEFTRAAGSIFLVAAVRRIRRPGCKFDEMLLLEGAQGSLKSSALKALMPKEEWFSDDLPLGVDAKQVIEQASGKWLIEAAELQGMSKANLDRLKGFLSRTHDKARMSYDRVTTEHPRQFILCGTTNREEYLLDTTGNRRFWPMFVGQVLLEEIRRDRDQIWAEAAHMEAAGYSIRLDPSLYAIEAQHQDRRRVEDPLHQELADHLSHISSTEANLKLTRADLNVLLHRVDGTRSDQRTNMRLGEGMKQLGWERRMVWDEGRPKHGFVKMTAGEGAKFHRVRISEVGGRVVVKVFEEADSATPAK